MILKRFCVFFSLLTCVQLIWGQTTPRTEARKYSNEFLKIGVGARAFGMGNTMVAAADDVLAGYWNPAGLVSSNATLQPEVSLMYASYFANIGTYNYGGFSIPTDSLGNRRFGISLIRLGVDDIPNTLDLVTNGNIDFNKVRSFSTSDFAALFSYAWKPQFAGGKLGFGTNFKLIYRGVGRFANAWGFGVDVAARYESKNLRAGVVLTDATETYNMWTFNTETFKEGFINTGNEIPQNSVEKTRPTLRLGIAYNIPLGAKLKLLAALDNDTYFDGRKNTAFADKGFLTAINPRAGFELGYLNKNGLPLAFLRFGAYNLQKSANTNGEEVVSVFPTAGVGFVIKNFTVDYALSNIGNFSQNLYSHVVSLKFYIPQRKVEVGN